MNKERKLYRKLYKKRNHDSIGLYLSCDIDRFDGWYGHRSESYSTKELVEYISLGKKIYYHTTWDNEYGIIEGDVFDLQDEINSIYDIDGWGE